MCSRQQGSLGSPALWLLAGDAENEVSWHRCSLLSTAHGIIVYTFSSLVFAGIAFWDEKMAQRTQPDPIQGFSRFHVVVELEGSVKAPSGLVFVGA